MSVSLGKKHKHSDRASDPGTSSHGHSGSQVITKDKVKKKRIITSFDATEETPKKTYNQISKSQDTLLVYSNSKRRKTGNAYIEEPTDPEHKETYRKKESCQEAADITSDDASSSVLQQQHNEMVKKSHKAKDSKKCHDHESLTEEASYSELANLEVRSKKKKKKPEKDSAEHLLEETLVEKLLTLETQHVTRKKKKQKCDGDLEEKDDEGNLQHGFTDELISKGKYPGRSETPEQMDKGVKKKRTKRKDDCQEAADIRVDDRNIKKSSKVKDLKELHRDEDLPEETVFMESVNLEHRPSMKKKKHKKDCREHVLQNSLVEELLTSEIQHTSKKTKKLKGGGDENHRPDCFTGELVTKRKHQDGPETIEQVYESADRAEDSLLEQLFIPETQHVSKKKRKDGGGLQGEDDISNLQHGFIEELVSERKYPDGSETPGQVTGSVKKKRKREYDSQEADTTVDNENFKKSCKAQDLKRFHGDEDLPEIFNGVLADIGHGPSLKKKPKKDYAESILDDSLVEESFISEMQHTSKKKTKRKRGGPESHLQDRFTEELVCERRPQGGSEIMQQVDKCVSQTEDSLVEELLAPETQHAYKKKKQKDAENLHKHVFTVIFSPEKHQDCSGIPEQVDESMDQGEPPVKKKKRKDDCQQETITVDDAFSSVGLTGEEPSYSKLTDTADRLTQKKTKKDHREPPLEDNLVEESLNPHAKHTSKKKTKRKDGGGENLRRYSFAEELVQYQGGSQNTKQMDETVDKAEAHMKKTKERKEDSESDKRLAILERARQKAHARRKELIASLSKEDLALIREYFPRRCIDKLAPLVIFSELNRIRLAKQNGMTFRAGQFTFDEDEQIQMNVQKFMAEVGIPSADMLFHPFKFPDLKKTIETTKKKFNFPQRIAQGVYRPICQVLKRGMKLFRFTETSGRYSMEEVKQLKKYSEVYGNKWTMISVLLNRSQMSTQLKASQLRREVNVGKWSVEEMNNLISAVKEFVLDRLSKEKNNKELVTVPKERLYSGISWVKIEEKVETRNWTNCKSKWYDLLLKRMNNYIDPLHGTLGIQSFIKIIRWMRDTGVREYGDVNWNVLSFFVGNVPPFLLQNRFTNLKNRVPDWKKLRLYEIVNYLYKNIMPELEAKLSAAEEPPIEPEKRDEFLISEVFQEYSESEEKWSLPDYVAELRGDKGPCALLIG